MDAETRKILAGAVVGTASAITVNRVRRVIDPVAPQWIAWPIGVIVGYAAAQLSEPIRGFLEGGNNT